MDMTLRHLPDPTKMESHGKVGGSLETIMTGSPVSNVEPDHIRLAPILRNPFANDAPSTSEMSRTPSLSSASSCNYTTYYGSRSASPTSVFFLEPPHGQSPPLNRVSMVTRHFRSDPYPTPVSPVLSAIRCQTCLKHSETVFVEPGKACPLCHHIVSEPGVAGKVSRKKRTDRYLYAHQNTAALAPKLPKKNVESGRRFLQVRSLARLQNVMLESNPNLPEDAAPREGREEGGWLALKVNNVSLDVPEHTGTNPLKYGKMDASESAIVFIEHSNHIINDVVDERKALKSALAARILSGAPYEELVHFLNDRLLDNDFELRVAKSSAHRGDRYWRSPSQSRLSAQSNHTALRL